MMNDICDDCECERTYCNECGTMHHVDTFNIDHNEKQGVVLDE